MVNASSDDWDRQNCRPVMGGVLRDASHVSRSRQASAPAARLFCKAGNGYGFVFSGTDCSHKISFRKRQKISHR